MSRRLDYRVEFCAIVEIVHLFHLEWTRRQAYDDVGRRLGRSPFPSVAAFERFAQRNCCRVSPRIEEIWEDYGDTRVPPDMYEGELDFAELVRTTTVVNLRREERRESYAERTAFERRSIAALASEMQSNDALRTAAATLYFEHEIRGRST